MNSNDTQLYWDSEAANFDEPADHGLKDDSVKQAWTKLFTELLPVKTGTVLDIGCGTGTLSVLLSQLGYKVTGTDISPKMIAQAKEKAHQNNVNIDFAVADAFNPDLPPDTFDVIISRHLIWAVPNYPDALKNWAKLVKPGGYFVFIEGYWHTDVGLHQEELIAALPPSFKLITQKTLNTDDALWGQPVKDERYALVAQKSQ